MGVLKEQDKRNPDRIAKDTPDFIDSSKERGLDELITASKARAAKA